MKYHIVQLGCQMNISDGERTQRVLEGMGYELTDKEEEANLLGVIACSVRQKGIDKVYSKVSKWNKWKNRKSLITFVSGCVLPADKEQFLKLFDLVFPMSELPNFPEIISQYGVVTPAGMQSLDKGLKDIEQPEKKSKNVSGFRLKPAELPKKTQQESVLETNAHIEDFWQIAPKYGSGFEAYIPIQNGCDKFCTYCAVPYTRGREVSRPSAEILDELKQLVDKGFKSITLLGQNVNSYGLDKKGNEISFAGLLEEIGRYGEKSGKDFWVYFTSPHPRDMGDDVLEAIARYSCLAKQIHLPVQSGDDRMLIRMNRKHSIDKYRKIIHSIHRLLPTATIFTDIIVGFTGETEEEFENTRRLMQEFKYNMAYIAQYSPRPGAASSRWADDIPKEIKKKRYHDLTEELMKHSLVYNQKMIGNTYKVLVRGKDRKTGYLSALTEGKIIIRFASEDETLLGTFVNVKVNSAVPFSTEGELIPDRK
ncbi:MAG: MiaB/RimO family radical SAM methylthiotransferase [Bacteroidales bacterium]|nr:MiaB/RimO family radical SAM methylthiotransferase [Bacteroidales bacterium]MCF6341617.1 MiaB/RimO family radical SAM methylthiotransferase [Bacteroidales bacterium]